MSITARIQQAAGTLTPSEQRLVQEIVSSPRAAALGTVIDLARAVGVHEATASRLARKLGFSSYGAFRRAVRDEFMPTQDPALRVKNTLADAADGDLLARLIGQEIDALARIRDYVQWPTIREAAAMLMDARKLFVFARGNAETLAVMVTRRFRRFGRDVLLMSGEGRDLAEQALEMRAGDCVLAFAFRRAPKGYAPLIAHAAASEAHTIVVSGALGPTLSPAPDVLLSVPRAGRTDSFQTLTVPMAVCNALILAGAAIDEQSTLRQLERLGGLIERFELNR